LESSLKNSFEFIFKSEKEADSILLLIKSESNHFSFKNGVNISSFNFLALISEIKLSSIALSKVT